jgi:hypothetical protein
MRIISSHFQVVQVAMSMPGHIHLKKDTKMRIVATPMRIVIRRIRGHQTMSNQLAVHHPLTIQLSD